MLKYVLYEVLTRVALTGEFAQARAYEVDLGFKHLGYIQSGDLILDEVLVTSLVDELTYPNELFKELYHLRWGIETFYGFLKTRLELEHFSGKTVESLSQDF